MKKETKRIYYVEYKDASGYRSAEEVEIYESDIITNGPLFKVDVSTEDGVLFLGEKLAVLKVQQTLINEFSYMSKLIDVYDITPAAIHPEDAPNMLDAGELGFCTNESEWKLKDGTVLDQESQDALNEAMNKYVNDEGMTLKEAFEQESKNK